MIDNFSRRILGWRVSEKFDPTNTLAILLEAGNSTVSTDSPPTVFADNGVENKTKAIDELVNSAALRRIFAQTEIACSNSMIEFSLSITTTCIPSAGRPMLLTWSENPRSQQSGSDRSSSGDDDCDLPVYARWG